MFGPSVGGQLTTLYHDLILADVYIGASPELQRQQPESGGDNDDNSKLCREQTVKRRM